MTDTLALWTGRGLAVEILRRIDGACPDPLVADWRTTRLDLVCLTLAGAAVVVLLTSAGDVAIAMGITARGLGAVPTVVKAWQAPRAEQTTVYAAGAFGAVCTLVAAPGWAFRTVGFAVYFLLFCAVMTVLVSRGERLARRNLRDARRPEMV